MNEVLVLGSQAILATRAEDELPQQATLSREADIAAWDDPDESLSQRLAGVLGQDSAFDHVNGYFVDGVSAATAALSAQGTSRRWCRPAVDRSVVNHKLCKGGSRTSTARAVGSPA